MVTEDSQPRYSAQIKESSRWKYFSKNRKNQGLGMSIQGLEIRHGDWISTRYATVTCHIFHHSSLHLSSIKGEEIGSKRTQERASTYWHIHYSRTYWHTLSLNLLLYIYVTFHCIVQVVIWVGS